MQIHGFNKTTLLDYPGHLASTIFLGGCNFRCPFCHNASLVLTPSNEPTIPLEEVIHTLKKRTGIIEGICITGGEPTLYPGLKKFIQQLKDMNFLIKLDTNGYNPEVLIDLITNHLVDYVAMDIKNSKEKYSLSTGIPSIDINRIDQSVSFLLLSHVPYEFRTTVVKEHHNAKDFISIGEWIDGASAYYLQPYQDSDNLILQGLSSYNKDDLSYFQTIVTPYVKNVSIRGMD